jgi:alkylation response protein AidB-like acyl-CoA dehydrogenase
MSLDLSQERRELLSVAGELLDALAPLSLARAFLEQRGEANELWAAIAGLGWYGIGLADDDPFGVMGLCLLAWQCGAHAAPTPLVDTAVAARLAAGAPAAAATAAGERTAALAFLECEHDWQLAEPATVLRDDRLSGTKLGVRHAAAVDVLSVVADTPHGPAVAFVGPADPGVSVTPVASFDPGSGPCRVEFRDTPVTLDAVLGSSEAQRPLETALAVGMIATAAEGLGAASRALTMAVDYSRDRQQFGSPIGSFQALQHLMAHAYVEYEIAWATVLAAAGELDAQASGAEGSASLAKALASRASRSVIEVSLQVHGGIAFTWEHDVHLLQRRVLECEQRFGDAIQHERIQGDLIARRAGAAVRGGAAA